MRIHNRDRATELAKEACFRSAILADASDRNGLTGIGVVHSSGTTTSTCELTNDHWPSTDVYPRAKVAINSDSQSALQTLANPGQQSGQALLWEIMELIRKLANRWAPLPTFQWVPSHSGIARNAAGSDCAAFNRAQDDRPAYRWNQHRSERKELPGDQAGQIH